VFVALNIPDKTYFKIGEVAKLIEVKPYIIRYWESEFRVLRPSKTKSQQRLFRRKDIELLMVIRSLLYAHRFTVEGARQRLREIQALGLSTEEILASLDQGVVPSAGSAPARAVVEGESRQLPLLDGSDAVEMAETRARSAAQDAELFVLRGELATIARERERLRGELDEAEERGEARARAELEAVRDELGGCIRARDAASARVSGLEAEATWARVDAARLAEELASSRAAEAGRAAELATSTQALAGREQLLATVRAEAAAAVGESSRAASEARTALESARARIGALEATVSEVKARAEAAPGRQRAALLQSRAAWQRVLHAAGGA
jgi:DNA-binding transcriptional MerR regulator